MKRIVVAVTAFCVSGGLAAADIAVSVATSGPAYYGRLEVGNLPPPQLVYAQPILVEPTATARQPIYLHVPPGHAKHWAQHCHRYNACAQPVYFVQDTWFNGVYVPHYRRTGQVIAPGPVPVATPTVAYVEPAGPRYFVVPVMTVRAVVDAPEQRCWVERQQVVERSDGPNIPGAIAGAVIGGVLGHQIGGGRGKDVATVGGAVAGGAIGANVGRGETQVYSQDVQRCARVERDARPAYWDVTYRFHGVVHRAQLAAPPGRTITVNLQGEPRT
jgi:uncharacterized protein YcfJ